MLRLPNFTLLQPQTLSEALALLAVDPHNTAILAGGTDLLPNMKRRQQTPRRLISLRHVSELHKLTVSDSEIRIGGAVRLRAIEDAPIIAEEAMALRQAVSQIATVHIRGTATLGGNLCLDTRCDYYNQSEPWRQAIGYCKKKDGDICWVATSSPRCLAVSSTDAAPALMALDAKVQLRSVRGDRELSLSDLYHNDGIHYLTKRPDELLTQVRIPRRPGLRSAYWKLRRRGAARGGGGSGPTSRCLGWRWRCGWMRSVWSGTLAWPWALSRRSRSWWRKRGSGSSARNSPTTRSTRLPTPPIRSPSRWITPTCRCPIAKAWSAAWCARPCARSVAMTLPPIASA
jgi:4-hydroxybenzoyl-CoA reductase subunit beta